MWQQRIEVFTALGLTVRVNVQLKKVREGN